MTKNNFQVIKNTIEKLNKLCQKQLNIKYD